MSFQSPKYARKRLERRREVLETRLESLKDNPKQAAYAQAALDRINRQLDGK